MIEKLPSSSVIHTKAKKVLIQERSIRVGDFTKFFLLAKYQM